MLLDFDRTRPTAGGNNAGLTRCRHRHEAWHAAGRSLALPGTPPLPAERYMREAKVLQIFEAPTDPAAIISRSSKATTPSTETTATPATSRRSSSTQTSIAPLVINLANCESRIASGLIL